MRSGSWLQLIRKFVHGQFQKEEAQQDMGLVGAIGQQGAMPSVAM